MPTEKLIIVTEGKTDVLIIRALLNKELTTEQNLAAVETLKRIGLLFSYGFMLFDPSSTFESVRENLGFLRQIVGDGAAAATFCRMLPYGGTPIRDLLAREGRLRGDLTHPDYDFLDVRLNEYYHLLHQSIRPWMHNYGLSNELNYAWDELAAVRRLIPRVMGIEAYASDLRAITREANERLFCLVEESLDAFQRGHRTRLDAQAITAYCDRIQARLVDRRNNFVADNIYELMETVAPESARAPVMAPQVH